MGHPRARAICSEEKQRQVLLLNYPKSLNASARYMAGMRSDSALVIRVILVVDMLAVDLYIL